MDSLRDERRALRRLVATRDALQVPSPATGTCHDRHTALVSGLTIIRPPVEIPALLQLLSTAQRN